MRCRLLTSAFPPCFANVSVYIPLEPRRQPRQSALVYAGESEEQDQPRECQSTDRREASDGDRPVAV
jgi:hypothetical protein